MRRSSKAVMWIGSSFGVAVLGLGAIGRAQVVADGTVSPSEGYSLEATQTVNTGFGDSTIGDGTSNGGSEMDAAYAVVSGGYLNIVLTGNYENNGNHVNLFVDDGRLGQSTLALPGGDSMSAMNGSNFSPGFQATYALDANDYANTTYVEEYTLTAPATLSGAYVGSIGLTGGIGSATPGAATIGWNDTNALGVNGNGGTAANPADADAVATGMEISIPLSVLGNPTAGDNIMVLADLNGGGDNYLSNQFLPGLPVGTGNLGNGGIFDFSGTPGEYFTVAVPEPASMSLLGGAVMMLFARRRKA